MPHHQHIKLKHSYLLLLLLLFSCSLFEVATVNHSACVFESVAGFMSDALPDAILSGFRTDTER